ncbi:unnamed protein product [Urochloa humidicola]
MAAAAVARRLAVPSARRVPAIVSGRSPATTLSPLPTRPLGFVTNRKCSSSSKPDLTKIAKVVEELATVLKGTLTDASKARGHALYKQLIDHYVNEGALTIQDIAIRDVCRKVDRVEYSQKVVANLTFGMSSVLVGLFLSDMSLRNEQKIKVETLEGKSTSCEGTIANIDRRVIKLEYQQSAMKNEDLCPSCKAAQVASTGDRSLVPLKLLQLLGVALRLMHLLGTDLRRLRLLQLLGVALRRRLVELWVAATA